MEMNTNMKLRRSGLSQAGYFSTGCVACGPFLSNLIETIINTSRYVIHYLDAEIHSCVDIWRPRVARTVAHQNSLKLVSSQIATFLNSVSSPWMASKKVKLNLWLRLSARDHFPEVFNWHIFFFEWYCDVQNRAAFLVCQFSCNPRVLGHLSEPRLTARIFQLVTS